MLTETEKVIVEILKKLQIDWDSIVGIMLMLKEKEHEQNLLIEYLKTVNPSKITTSDLVSKVIEIAGDN